MGADCASCISELERKNELKHDPYGTGYKASAPTPQQKVMHTNETPFFNPTPSHTPWKAKPAHGDNLASSDTYRSESQSYKGQQIQDEQEQEVGQISDKQASESDGFVEQQAPKERRKTDINSALTLIRVQALIRGFIQRRRFRIQQVGMTAQSRYFKASEAAETLTGVYNPNAPIETRDYTYKTGAIYSGQWKGGMRHGKGTMKWADGATYEGEWQMNTAFGQGKFYHVAGDVYDGKWVNNRANGMGTYTNVKGASYEGLWKNDQQHGQGVEQWQEGAIFEGEYQHGKKEGFGKYTYADGSTYEGSWSDNQMSGYGIQLWADGKQYFGQWLASDMSGFGFYQYADKVRYDGQFVKDKKQGFGIYTWTDGRKYEGWWNKNKQHGYGTYTGKDQSVKYGLWENGKRLKWLSENEVSAINAGTFDLAEHFKDAKSKTSLPQGCSFKRPEGWLQGMEAVQEELDIPLPSIGIATDFDN